LIHCHQRAGKVTQSVQDNGTRGVENFLCITSNVICQRRQE
jgi:hypothetical protein